MPAQINKVAYKVSGTEYFVLVEGGNMVSKWKEDKTIPLSEVVGNFNVNISDNGEVSTPRKGQLESDFSTSDPNEVIKKILENGDEKAYDKK